MCDDNLLQSYASSVPECEDAINSEFTETTTACACWHALGEDFVEDNFHCRTEDDSYDSILIDIYYDQCFEESQDDASVICPEGYTLDRDASFYDHGEADFANCGQANDDCDSDNECGDVTAYFAATACCVSTVETGIQLITVLISHIRPFTEKARSSIFEVNEDAKC